MKRNYLRKLFLAVFVLVLCVVAAPMAKAATAGMVVGADSLEMTVSVNGVGTEGTATVYRVAANQYFTGDPLTGKSTNIVDTGAVVGEYTCGSKQTFKLDRIADDGSDNIYDKFYIVQNGKILAGPTYATEIDSVRSVPRFVTGTKKGVTIEDAETIDIALEMGAGSTVVNMDLTSMIISPVDENGNPRHLNPDDVIEYYSNGKTFYFNKFSMESTDWLIKEYSKAGINVTMVIIAWTQTMNELYPREMMYFEHGQRETMAFNTCNDLGMEYFIAAIEYLSDRYSRTAETGLVNKYVIGNEIDFSYDWNPIEPVTPDKNGEFHPVDLDIYMEEYARTLRLANLAVKKYNSEAHVCVSLTHQWMTREGDMPYSHVKAPTNISYSPRQILDWLVKNETARGNYDWAIAQHPYPLGMNSSHPLLTDTNGYFYNVKITGDPDTTPLITVSNLEVLQLYLERPENMFNGEVRRVSLTETCIATFAQDHEAYEESARQQAASVAQTYYRAVHIPCIDEVDYFYQSKIYVAVGLTNMDGSKKPAWDVWKHVDTVKSFDYANLYLSDITMKSSYKNIMPTVESAFDWDAVWDYSKIAPGTYTVTFKDLDGTELHTGTYSYWDELDVPEVPEKEGYSFIGWDDVTRYCRGDAVYTARYKKHSDYTGVQRVSGATRFETAYAAAGALKEQMGVEKFQSIVVACGTEFADALSGSYLANQKNAPIILIKTANRQINDAKKFIKENVMPGGTVYLLGGEKAIPKTMEPGLGQFVVKRLSGKNRYETNLAILKEAGVGNKDILVCTGTEFADGLSASATNRPVLLVKDALSEEQKAFLETCKGNNIYIIGGKNAVTSTVEKQLKAYGTPTRIEGATRYATSVNIAKTFFPNASSAVLAYGQNFPDGLAGGSLGYTVGAPLILTASGKQGVAVEYAKEANITNGIVLGGKTVVSDKIIKSIFRMDGNAVITQKEYVVEEPVKPATPTTPTTPATTA